MIQQKTPSLSYLSSSDLIYLLEEVGAKTDPLSLELSMKIRVELDRRISTKEAKRIDLYCP